MTEWWLDFLSNMLAGLVSGAVLGLFAAAASRRSGRQSGESSTRRTANPPQILIDARSQRFEQQVFSIGDFGSEPQRRRLETALTSRDDQDPWIPILAGGLACLAAAWGYLRYQETVLLAVVFLAAFLSAFVVAAIVYAVRSGISFKPSIVLESVVFLIAVATVLANIYFLNVARNTPEQQALGEMAAGSLTEFASSASPEEWFAIVYQLLGLLASVLVLILISGSGVGVLALIRGARVAFEGRRPSSTLARLAGLRFRGCAFVAVAVLMSSISILLSSGLMYGWVANSWTGL